MSITPKLSAAFTHTAARGYTHVLLVEDRAGVPHNTQVAHWQATSGRGAPAGRRNPIALYDLKDPSAPRWCQNPRLLARLDALFAVTVSQLPAAPAGAPGVAVIVARPVAKKG